MHKKIKHILLLIMGWLCISLAIIGAILPLMPTTIFLIIALACFAESSPRFHQMLLENKWFGPPLQQWQKTHSIKHSIKLKVYFIITVSFALSIGILWGRPYLQLLLVVIAISLILCITRIKEIED
ncbi:MAG TPA: DUF454 domain-containing protein [Methylophaga aminisulfidivorans]|uniref:Inner membrane protein n=2 Tax=root TaxID=1 RepID=A0A7C1VQ40_9GAMM|nr:DUF454 domain-containing protein [Methylophaga aminisulfidivorans]